MKLPARTPIIRTTSSSPCELLPPCDEGNHGTNLTIEGSHLVARPIGKYYFTEDALKHDLAALKRNEIYDSGEFYKRAKAWYKAEIDRLLHFEKALGILQGPYSHHKPLDLDALDLSPPCPPRTPSPPQEPREPSSTPAKPPKPRSLPTRIQPDRAAKRRRPPSPSPRPPPRRKKRPRTDPLAPIQIQNLNDKDDATGQKKEGKDDKKKETTPVPMTKGDYTLATYDWKQFRNGNEGEHRPSPWAYVQLQGLDVAYFVMRVERAVRSKVEEVLERGSGEKMPVGAKMDRQIGEGGSDDDKAARQECKHVRCALGHRYEKPPPFEPAAALAPGEDWRPPGGHDQVGHRGASATTDNFAVDSDKTSSWAADEVERREEMNKRAVQAAPEAEMEISPTLGRWPAQRQSMVSLEGKREGRTPVEDLTDNVVEVSGLRFAVDLCASPGAAEGAEEYARFLML